MIDNSWSPHRNVQLITSGSIDIGNCVDISPLPPFKEDSIMYAIQNQNKPERWYRSGFGRRQAPDPWVDSLNDARLYNKLSQARSAVTRLKILHLSIVKFSLVCCEVLDESNYKSDKEKEKLRRKELKLKNSIELEKKLRDAKISSLERELKLLKTK